MRQELLEILEAVREEEREILEEGAGIRKDLYTEGDPFIVTARKMMGDDQKLIQIRTHTRFIAFPRHRHDFIEMMYVCKGSCTHIIDGQEITVQAGEFLLLNQYSWHEIKKAEKDDISVNFVIRPEFFDKPYTMLGFNNIITDFLINVMRKNSSQGEFLYFQVADAVPVQNLIENMVWTIFYDISNKRSSNQITMGLLFLQLLNYMDKMEAGGRKFDTEIMANVYRYIEDHFKEGTLSELAVEMKVDVYWLSREIKKKSGKTYKELLQEKRMQQAVYLLINSRIAVSDIIEAVGYDNTSYFYRKFKERYGISPKEYRIENMN